MIQFRSTVFRRIGQGLLERIDLKPLRVLRKNLIELYNGKMLCRHDINSLNGSGLSARQNHGHKLGNVEMEDIRSANRQANRDDFLQKETDGLQSL